MVPPIRQARQNSDVTVAPSATGLGGVITAAVASSAPSLRFDSTAGTGTLSAPPLAITDTPTITTSSPSPPVSQSSSPTSSPASASSKSIALSTVVASCVGAFVGAIALIILGFWFYRRYLQTLKKSARSRQPMSPSSRNTRGDQQRRRSHLEAWNKLEEADGDRWEGMDKPQGVRDSDATAIAPAEKLGTMFKKSPSVRTAYTHKSDEAPAFDVPHPFAQYHPDLAKELASGDEGAGVPVARPFAGRTNVANEVSWGGETLGQDSFLSLRSTRLSGGAMSPTLNMAIPTPPATTSELHRWESAEVVQFDEGHVAEVHSERKSRNPFEPDAAQRENRKSSHNNPFFNAQDYPVERRRSTSRPRSNSTGTKSSVAKGKERAVSSSDPFADENIPLPKPPTLIHHVATSSASSVSSNDRAIQSLIAALDITEEEVQNRLRVASMQPSVYSATSAYTTDEDVTERFPLPPNASSTSINRT